MIGKGENIDYDCIIQTSSSAEISNSFFSISYPIIIGREVVEFHNINFGEEAAEEAAGLVEINNFTKINV